MNTLFEAIKTVILITAVMKTASYGVWCVKNKNISGGIMLFFLCVSAAALFFFNEVRLYI